MIRLHFVVEGHTEEAFVNNVLIEPLAACGVFADCRMVLTGSKGGRQCKGGVTVYSKIRNDLVRWMKEDRNPEVRFTTFFDLYRFPSDAPGFEETRTLDSCERARRIADAMAADLVCQVGDFPADRLLPYIQPYEFEALLFAAPATVTEAHAHWTTKTGALHAIRSGYPSPEHINDDDPPSKRLKGLLDDYEKVADGIQIAQSIGLPAIRNQCRHFDAWLTRIERLSAGT